MSSESSIDCAPGLHHPPIPCRYCGVIDRPLLTSGTGPHRCKATCAHCGRHLRWVSLLAPAERLARRMKARLEAMQKHPPSAAQLDYLKALQTPPTHPFPLWEFNWTGFLARLAGGKDCFFRNYIFVPL